MSVTQSFFTSADLSLLVGADIPQHVAIIPDGNRRWARQNGLNPILGHHWGAEAVIDIVVAAKELGIRYLTFYSFSTENWKRSKEEVDAWMQLFALMLEREQKRMIEEGMKLWTIGELSLLPEFVQESIQVSKNVTSDNSDIHLILAVNYGARDEMKRAFMKLLELERKGQLSELSEELISSCLDTGLFPDPELIIRTSGEKRLSNFLLWQASYSEYQAPDILWPDFRPQHLLQAIIDYQKRQRRLGA
jgi:undecaprenyl diphosphate synthase